MKYRHGILGKMSGSIADITCESHRKRNVIKGKQAPGQVNTTQAQLDQQAKLQLASDFIQFTQPDLYQTFWLAFPQKPFAWAAFCSANLQAFSNAGLDFAAPFIASVGPVPTLKNMTVDVNGAIPFLRINWTYFATQLNVSPTDQLQALWYNETQDVWTLKQNQANRSAGIKTMGPGVISVGDVFHIWAWFTNPAFTQTGLSSYASQVAHS